jgi:hypothetical protein
MIGPVRHALAMGCIVLVTCARPLPNAAPRADGGSPDPVVSLPDAAPPPSAPPPAPPAAHAWIRFTTEPFDPGAVPDSPRDEVPHWTFESELPAVDGDAARVFVPERVNAGLADVPNFGVSTISVADERKLETTWLLDRDEMLHAMLDGEVPERRRALAGLESLVASRIAKMNAELDSRGVTRLSRCTVEDPYGVQPPCSMPRQGIVCGATTITYGSRTLTFRAPGVDTRRTFPKWKPKVERVSGAEIQRKECFAGAFADEKRRLFFGWIIEVCPAGGDGCLTWDDWHVVKW